MATTAVILAGGKSSRMGQDKALLTINGQSLVERLKDKLEQTSISQIVVSRNELRSDTLADKHPNKGPLSGIHSACFEFPEQDLLIVPVDLPLMDTQSLQQLIDRGVRRQINTCYLGHNLPLFLVNNQQTRHILEYTLIYTNCFSVGRFCSHFPIQELRLTRQSPLFNTNTPAQWRSVLQHFPEQNINQPKEQVHGTFE